MRSMVASLLALVALLGSAEAADTSASSDASAGAMRRGSQASTSASAAVNPKGGFKKMKDALLRAERLSTDADIAGFHAGAEQPSDADVPADVGTPSSLASASSLVADASLSGAGAGASASDGKEAAPAAGDESFDKLFKQAEASASATVTADPSAVDDASMDKLLRELNTSATSETPAGLDQLSSSSDASSQDGEDQDVEKLLKKEKGSGESLERTLAELKKEDQKHPSLEKELKELGPLPSDASNSSETSLDEQPKGMDLDGTDGLQDASKSLGQSLLDNGEASSSKSTDPADPSDDSMDTLLKQLNTSYPEQPAGLDQSSDDSDFQDGKEGVEDIDKILGKDGSGAAKASAESLNQTLAELHNEDKDQPELDKELKELGVYSSNSSGASLEEDLKKMHLDDASDTSNSQDTDSSQSPEQGISKSLLDNSDASSSDSGNWSLDSALSEIGDGWHPSQSSDDFAKSMSSNNTWLDEELKKVDSAPLDPKADSKWMDDTLQKYQAKEEDKSIAELAQNQLASGTADGKPADDELADLK